MEDIDHKIAEMNYSYYMDFAEWCILNIGKTYKGIYFDIEADDKEFNTTEEVYDYWKVNFAKSKD